MNISVIDYGLGNVKSVCNALEYVGAKVDIVESESLGVFTADKIVMPGVGHFSEGSSNLFGSPIGIALQQTNKPILGICLGMQLLLQSSDETSPIRWHRPGLGLIDGKYIRVTQGKVPRIGWYRIDTGEWMYFAHSYVAAHVNQKDVWFTSDGMCAGVRRKNVSGVQFHPEKSGASGLAFLKKWINE